MLTESQQKAVDHGDGPAMVLAGPGSGKTTVITNRILSLIRRGAEAEKILVITFTRAAAEEMRQRFEAMAAPARPRVTFGTFHAVFFHILRYECHYSAENILRPEQGYRILDELTQQRSMEADDRKEWIGLLLTEISLVKSEGIGLEHYFSTVCPEDEFRKIYRAYQRRLEEARLIDFDDMGRLCLELFKRRADVLAAWQQHYQYILVDEFQDINNQQYSIVRLLAQPRNNLFIVGDDDQSIYRFRGSRPEIMLNFPKDYPDCHVIELDENFRSTQTIVKESLKVIGENRQRFAKQLRSCSEMGQSVDIRSFRDEETQLLYVIKGIRDARAAGTPLSEIAILTRTNAGGRQIAGKLMEFELPFRMKDVIPDIYDHWIAKDIFAYLRMAECARRSRESGSGDARVVREDLLRVMNRPNRYISRAAVDAAREKRHGGNAAGTAQAERAGAAGRGSRSALRNGAQGSGAAGRGMSENGAAGGGPGGHRAAGQNAPHDGRGLRGGDRRQNAGQASPWVSLGKLEEFYDAQEWMWERLDRLAHNLSMLAHMRPYAAVNYLRRGMEYDDFLTRYALKRRLKAEDLLAVADELQEAARPFDSAQAWSDHIALWRREMAEVRRQMKEESAGKKEERITLSTLHSSKGLEFDEVFILDVNEDVIPYRKAALETDFEEERRLFYVGMTRARKRLHLLCVRERYNKVLRPSRFLDVLGGPADDAGTPGSGTGAKAPACAE